MRYLIENKAETNVKDSYQNGIVHIAMNNKNNVVLEYLLTNLPQYQLNMFDRNTKGETPLSMAQELKNF